MPRKSFPTGVPEVRVSAWGGAEFFVGCDAGFSPKLTMFEHE